MGLVVMLSDERGRVNFKCVYMCIQLYTLCVPTEVLNSETKYRYQNPISVKTY